jgi:hypothetical protein
VPASLYWWPVMLMRSVANCSANEAVTVATRARQPLPDRAGLFFPARFNPEPVYPERVNRARVSPVPVNLARGNPVRLGQAGRPSASR